MLILETLSHLPFLEKGRIPCQAQIHLGFPIAYVKPLQNCSAQSLQLKFT